jgi:3'(2'), 5'-bisphosphate nucleotidase
MASGKLNVDHNALAEALLPAVMAAGACLLRHQAAGVATEQKSDGSPVSRADREAESILLAALAKAAPGVPVIAEEEVSAGRTPEFTDSAFLVDALDGTREFLSGSLDFTVNIGLVVGHLPVFGIVLAPALGRLFLTTGAGQAAQGLVTNDMLARSEIPLLTKIGTVEPDKARVRVITSRSSRSDRTEAFIRRFSISEDQRMGSSIKFGIIAAGEADFYPRVGPTSQWDIAAGHAVLAAAGGTVTTIEGKPFRYLDKTIMPAAEPFLNPPFVAWGRASLITAY